MYFVNLFVVGLPLSTMNLFMTKNLLIDAPIFLRFYRSFHVNVLKQITSTKQTFPTFPSNSVYFCA